MNATRRLAEILAADVAGYSRLIGADEKGTLDRIRSIREVVDGHPRHRRSCDTCVNSLVRQAAIPNRDLRCPVHLDSGKARRT
jgi:hypothetical protein